MKKFSKIRTNDSSIDRIQDNIENSISPVLNNPVIDGVLVAGVRLLSSGANVINNPLQREIVGWIVVDKNANANIWRGTSANNRVLNFLTSANVTVSLYIF